MNIPLFSNMRIRIKLIIVSVFLVLFPLILLAALSMMRFGTALRKAYEEDLNHLVRNIYSMCRVYEEIPQTKEQSIYSLKKAVKEIRVGKTGYIYIIDIKGNLIIHPVKEGTNILNAKDSSGFAYIRTMIDTALKSPPGKVGTIRYPWINPEFGETKPRQKISKFIFFKPWNWIIVAGTYEREVYEALYATEKFIVIIVLISVAVAFALTLTLSKLLTNPIMELTRVTSMMADGDLSQRVRIIGGDEISILGTSFNRLIGQIQNYTSNLEKMVEERAGELNESREKYRDLSRFLNTILNSSTQIAIIALDHRGNIIEFNKGAENVFGWKKDDVLNLENISITNTPEDKAQGLQKEIMERTKKEGVYDLEMYRVRKDGSRFPSHTTINAIRELSGRETGFVEIVRDITKRKFLEKELRETKDFLENIMESSVDGIITTDLKGKITYMNRAMEEVLQYTRQEILGDHISLYYMRGIQEARDIMDLLRKRNRVKDYEIELKGRGEKVVYILTSLFMLKNEDGQPIGTAGIFKDISEQKLLEEKLIAAQVRLVEASKMRALGELVAGVAHEINNPLMASQTILHVIKKNLPEGDQEMDRLNLIQRCNDRIENIVEHLREFSRQKQPDFSYIDINDPIKNALMMTGQQLLDHNIGIEKRLSEDLPKVSGDTNQLEQVFLNLISNARDAMDDITGKKELTISSYLTEEDGIEYIGISVKDTGVGIPDENRNKIIEPFFTTKPVGKGTGLGLSLCFSIIESHAGRIEIKSKPGKGTEVNIFIPVNRTGKEKSDGKIYFNR